MNNEINRFDSALKESAANFELPFNEEAWDLMNKKLDANDSDNKKGKRKFIILLIGAIAVLVGGYTYFSSGGKNKKAIAVDNKINNSLDKSNNINNEKSIINNLKSNDKYSLESKKDINVKSNQNRINKKSINDSLNDLFDVAKTTALSETKNKNATNIKNKNIDNQLNININKYKKENKIVDKTGIVNKVTPKIDIPDLASNSINTKNTSNALNKNNIDEALDLISNKSGRTVNIISNAQLHKKYLTNFKNAEVAASKNPIPDLSAYELNQVQLLPVYSEIPLANRWYIGGNLGADISYVYNPSLADAKFTYNLILGLNITNQVGFQTGIRFGNKQFDVRKGKFSYNGPNPTWDKYIRQAHSNIDAYEIPILVRYQFSEKPNTGLFCTAGFSVMFYQKEEYTLTLDYGTGIPVYKPYNFSKSNTELTMFNASLGYQFPINKRFTLTAEQYISLPTTNIGNAGMRMSSTGFQLGMRYNFLKK